jgi:hypothetical protein
MVEADPRIVLADDEVAFIDRIDGQRLAGLCPKRAILDDAGVRLPVPRELAPATLAAGDLDVGGPVPDPCGAPAESSRLVEQGVEHPRGDRHLARPGLRAPELNVERVPQHVVRDRRAARSRVRRQGGPGQREQAQCGQRNNPVDQHLLQGPSLVTGLPTGRLDYLLEI